MTKKNALISFLILVFILAKATVANAVCPLCTVAVVFGVGLSRWLGVDDLITGVWIGGLLVSMIIWLLNWLKKKNVNFKFRGAVISILFYLIAFVPLFWTGILGHPLNKFLGIDRLIFGTVAGSLVFLAAVWLHEFLKKKNQGKPYFSYQKVIFPVGALIIATLTFYLIIYKL